MMNAKKIMLAVMCALLVIVIVMTGIFISRVSQLLQGFLGGGSQSGGSTTAGTTAGTTTTPTQTLPPTTVTPPTTVPPTTVPPTTVPPTTLPTEPEHVHEYVLEEHVEATCENMGYDIMVCSGCGRQDIQSMVDAFGHEYGPGQTIAPTCTEAGCTRSTCSRCGHVWERNLKDPLGHDYKLLESVTAACGVAGYDKLVCDRCQEETLQNEVPALEHQDVILVDTPATCTTDGLKQVQCGLCGRIEETVIPAPGHSFGEWITDAIGTYRVCAICGELEIDASAIQHTYGPWVGDSTGATRTCITCGNTETIAAAELVITSEQSMEVAGQRMISIQVGTTAEPDVLHFGISDFLNNGTLVYALDAARGLVVTYTNTAGEPVEVVRGFDEAALPIVISLG